MDPNGRFALALRLAVAELAALALLHADRARLAPLFGGPSERRDGSTVV